MKSIETFLFAIAFSLLASPNWLFPQVTPEFQIGARGVVSFNTDVVTQKTTSAVNDFSDSGLLVGFRQKMYNKFRGQLVIGFQFPDADSDLGQLFFHQTFVKLEDKSNIIKLGRSRVRSSLIEFPTLRDDDALPFTDVLNPFSNGENSEDNQYGNVAEYAHVFNQRYWIRVHGEHFTESPVPPATSETDFSLNALGFSLQYRVPESQRWNRTILQQIGFGFNNFQTDRPGYTSRIDRALKNLVFSTIVNLHPDPVYFWDFRGQVIYNLGFSEIKSISHFADLTRATSAAHIFSLRFLYRKLERPTLQFAVTGGFKVFPDLKQKARQWQLVGNTFYRLGDNFDVALQVQFKQFNGDLKNLYGDNQVRFQLGLVYSVDHSWNRQFDDRNSLLNLEHGYIP